jgi:uncharacterized protein (TIGR02588 family)
MTPERNPAAAVERRAEAATDEQHRSPGQATPLLEWIVGGLGAALVGGTIAFLVYHALARDQTPPDIRVVAERVLDLQHGYLVQFRAFNQGNSAAAEVGIEGELAGRDGDTEVSDVVLDYLPPHSDREGGLVFSRDPRTGQLSLRAKGHARP